MRLEKEKLYCSKCYQEGKIKELTKDDAGNLIVDCEHKGRYFSYLKWCDECDDFTSRRGLNKNALCYRCIMKNNCKKAIENGTHSSQNPETSLSNRKIHQKTIKSQIENGTFNMMNAEVHSIATKNKLKNYASGNCECVKCGKKSVLNSFGICSECQSNIAIKIREEKFCDKCNKITPHNGNKCIICFPESNPTGGGFVSKEWNEYIFSIDCNVNCSKYKNCNNKIYSKKNKWGYCNLIGNKLPNFIIKDGIKYVLNKTTNDYIEWNLKVEETLIKLKNEQSNIDIENLINKEGFNKEPIISLKNDIYNWNREATDEFLCDKGYKWIVYIKLFQNKPFIVGKTGTKLTSKSPIDFDFKVGNEDEDKYKGPGRQFIRENYPNIKFTDCKYVLVKNFNNEKEALDFEKYIAEKYNLFES